MVLVVGAGLFARTLMDLGHAELGFRPDNLLLFDIVPPEARYPGAASTFRSSGGAGRSGRRFRGWKGALA